MALENSQAFVAGFLLRCAEEGLSSDATNTRMKLACNMAKQALDPASTAVDIGSKAVQGLAKAAPAAWGIAKDIGAVGLGLPILAGGGLGYWAGRRSYSPTDVKDVQQQNMLATYMRLTEEAKRRRAIEEKKNKLLYG